MINENNWEHIITGGHTIWVCTVKGYEDWYIRVEERRVRKGDKEFFFVVGNDDTEYMKTFRSAVTAAAFAEKHFK